jgi:dUTP pyrophosphatase
VPARRYVVVLERSDPEVDVPAPIRATPGSAAFDLAAAETVRLRAGRITRVRTGLKARAPRGTFLEVRPRSGLASKGVVMANGPGTIDRDYAGELLVPLTYLLRGSYRIEKGDRIAQIRVVPDLPAEMRWGRVAPVKGRDGGFGSTGR